MKKIYVDIDQTICTSSEDGTFPILSTIEYINDLYRQGNHITYWTDRGNTSGKDMCVFTYNQLTNWGCLFHALKMGKPTYDVLIDKKSIHPRDLPIKP